MSFESVRFAISSNKTSTEIATGPRVTTLTLATLTLCGADTDVAGMLIIVVTGVLVAVVRA
jgi:hypothetical protein